MSDTLFTYWRSSAAYRVRIALNMKRIPFESAPIHLVRNGGEQLSPEYRKINPAAVVPALRIRDGLVLTQSLAILEYLEETHPDPMLLPGDALLRARVRAAAQLIASDIHPINNLRVAQYLKGKLGQSQEATTEWMRHWMQVGLSAYAELIDADAEFSFGDAPTLADICLVPQLYNARRWGATFERIGRLAEIERRCLSLDAFAAASPENQPDAEKP
jgi:maleylacetoacetate isomerase